MLYGLVVPLRQIREFQQLCQIFETENTQSKKLVRMLIYFIHNTFDSINMGRTNL